MVTITEIPMVSLNSTECSNTETPGAENSEPITADIFTPKVQESGNVGEPQPSCSGLHLKPYPKSELKSREDSKPGFPWRLLLPKRGISKLIFQIVTSTEKRKGISLQGIKKSVVATGYDLEKRKHYFKRVLRSLLAKGLLKKLTGHGLTGSYAISEMMRKVVRMRMRQRKRRRKIMTGFEKKNAPERKKRPRKKKVEAIKCEIPPETAVAC
ncbi:histone H1.9-like [Tiliqua scincoides]|uniref:histone H1.9-like n=1 Tax=Tiliqua scincoides TaxID=71010 RepID=UPI003462A2FF